MSFEIVNHDGRDFAVLLIPPNFAADDSHAIRYAARTELDEGGSGRETREPQQPDLRLKQTCAYTLRTKAEAAALRKRLAALDDVLVAVPLWCDKLTGAQWSDCLHTSGLIARLSDGALLAGDADLSPNVEYAPLLVGRFVEEPEITPFSKAAGGRTKIAIEDDSPWEYRIGINGVAVAGVWPPELVPAYTEALKDFSKFGRDYVQIGAGRERGVEHQEMAFKWGQEGDFKLRSRDEIRLMLATFAAHLGRWKNFTMPWWFTPGDDEPETPHETVVRLGSDSLDLAFSSGATAKTSLSFWQVPWEIAAPAGEVAAQPSRAYLYRHTLRVPVSPVVWRYTDYAKPVTLIEDGVSVTYFPAKIEHDKFVQGYMLEDDGLKLSSFVADSHPWMLILRRTVQAPLEVDVFECNPDNPTATVRLRHSGEISDTPSGKGRKLTAPTSGLGGLLDTEVPNFMVQEGCNWEWCSAACTKLLAAFTLQGTVTAIAGADVTVQITVDPTGVAHPADYFANGDAEFGAGLTWESRDIIRSTDLGSGKQKLTLDRAYLALTIGTVLTFHPTCTGTWAECQAYGNTVNYGGARFVGDDNISVPSRETNTQGGKK